MFQGQLQTALRTLYPPSCVACRAPVASDFGLCGSCLRDTPFIAGGTCTACGVPLAGLSEGEIDICEECLTVPRPWSRGRAAMTYEDLGRTLVLQLKHSDRTDLAQPAGAWLARAARPLVRGDTLVVPVPMHRTRLLKRTYNQAVLLARVAARHLERQMVPDILERTRRTPMQDHRSADERFANLDGAITVRGASARNAGLVGRHVLLVDDVMTSGATLSACATACLDAGAEEVDVAVLARVRRDEFVTSYLPSQDTDV